jgi:hypothetical protein
MELVRQRKDNMIVRAGQQVLLSFFNPLFTLMPLALGAMPVAAAVITDAYGPALIAGIYMAT